jgi:hypothetical protein
MKEERENRVQDKESYGKTIDRLFPRDGKRLSDQEGETVKGTVYGTVKRYYYGDRTVTKKMGEAPAQSFPRTSIQQTIDNG